MLKVLISTSLSTDMARCIGKNVSKFFNRFDDSVTDIFTTVECTGNTDRFDTKTADVEIIPVRLEFLKKLREADILVIIPKSQKTTDKNVSMDMGESVSWEYTIARSSGVPVLFWDLGNDEGYLY